MVAAAAVAVIADDLTGANADGILLARQGFRAIALLDPDPARARVGAAADAGAAAGGDGPRLAVAVNTDSRLLEPARAYERVRLAARALLALGVRGFGKRIDSTLRGNCGAEIDAALDALGGDACAVVVPAYPRSGRTTVDGVQLVDGVPLARTAAADDPLWPVRESSVPALLGRQTRRAVAHVGLADVRAGPGVVAAKLSSLCRDGRRVIVVDSETDADLDALALGACECGLRVVPVSPGPFTAAYLARRFGGTTGPASRDECARRPVEGAGTGTVLVVAGSLSDATRRQLDRLVAATGARLVRVDADALAAGGPAAEAEIERALADLHGDAPGSGVAGYEAGAASVEKGVGPVAARGHPGERMRRVARGLGELARRTVARGGFGAIYTTGGDVSHEVCRALGAWGIELIEEVMPLAAHGRLAGGEFAGLPIVTKGGLVGDEGAALACVRHLQMRMGERT